MIIGEALNQILKSEPDLESRVPDARQIINFRNILVHGYYAIEHDTVWGILEKDLSTLAKRVEDLLGQ